MRQDTVTYNDFSKLDIRVGKILAATPLKNSNKLMSVKVDLGEDYGEVEILAGLAGHYSPEDVIGKKMLFLANLEPKPMAGSISNGMLLALDQNNRPIIIKLDEELAEGTKLR